MSIAEGEFSRSGYCQRYDHAWRPTSPAGRFKCRTCGKVGCCSRCLLTIPQGTIKMRCERHKDKEVNRDPHPPAEEPGSSTDDLS